MPVLKIVNMAGKETGEITLSDAVFGAEVNATVLHTAVKAYLANQRQGTQSTLTRTEVSGGGRKPWRQKRTGPPELHSGHTAELRLDRNPENTGCLSTRR